MFYYRYNLKKNSKKEKLYTEKYQNLIISLLYSSEGEKEIIYELQRSLKSKMRKQIIEKIIFGLMSNISGSYNKKLKEIYYKIGLDKFSKEKLNNSKWHIKIKGMRELAIMGAHNELNSETPKYLSHKNKLLRGNSQLTLMKIEGVKSLDFLNDYKDDLYGWQQLEIMETLFKIKGPKFENIQYWLEAKNPTVNLFALKVIRAYSLIDYKFSVIKLIDNKNHLVRKHAILFIKKFKVSEAYFSLLALYEKSKDYFEKCIILETITTLEINGNKAYITEVKKQLEEENNNQTITIYA